MIFQLLAVKYCSLAIAEFGSIIPAKKSSNKLKSKITLLKEQEAPEWFCLNVRMQW